MKVKNKSEHSEELVNSKYEEDLIPEWSSIAQVKKRWAMNIV